MNLSDSASIVSSASTLVRRKRQQDRTDTLLIAAAGIGVLFAYIFGWIPATLAFLFFFGYTTFMLYRNFMMKRALDSLAYTGDSSTPALDLHENAISGKYPFRQASTLPLPFDRVFWMCQDAIGILPHAVIFSADPGTGVIRAKAETFFAGLSELTVTVERAGDGTRVSIHSILSSIPRHGGADWVCITQNREFVDAFTGELNEKMLQATGRKPVPTFPGQDPMLFQNENVPQAGDPGAAPPPHHAVTGTPVFPGKWDPSRGGRYFLTAKGQKWLFVAVITGIFVFDGFIFAVPAGWMKVSPVVFPFLLLVPFLLLILGLVFVIVRDRGWE